MKSEPQVFLPHALAKAPVTREVYWVDNTAPERDWSKFDPPAFERRTSKVIRTPMFLRKQAQ